MTEWVFKEGDRVATPYLDKGTVVEYMDWFDYPKVLVLVDGSDETSVWYADSLRLDKPDEELERVIARADYSESSDALALTAEIHRLRKAVRQAGHDGWEKGMADAKLQALGIRPLVRNPYLED